MSGIFFTNEQGPDTPAIQAGRLSVVEVVFATVVGRESGRTDDEICAAVSDICCRDVGAQELLEVAQRLVDQDVISAGSRLAKRWLTLNGMAVMKEAEDCFVRLIDNNSGLVVAGAMIGLFDRSNKE